MLEIATAYRDAGLSVIPVRCDGSKSPLLSWKPFTERVATDKELVDWFCGSREVGIGIVAGVISGGLEVLDFDAGNLFWPWKKLTEQIAIRLPTVETPSFGYHVFYRCDEVTGNHKIAIDPNAEKQTLIESRGDGGYVIGCGSPASCHPANYPYVQVAGPVLPEIPRITLAERRQLWMAARTFDRGDIVTEAKRKQAKERPTANRSLADTPWDDFDARADWGSILEPRGWKSRDGIHWTRPGKTRGTSATLRDTADGQKKVLVVFSSNANLDSGAGHKTYSKFNAYAQLYHAGSKRSAAQELRRNGYGGSRPC